MKSFELALQFEYYHKIQKFGQEIRAQDKISPLRKSFEKRTQKYWDIMNKTKRIKGSNLTVLDRIACLAAKFATKIMHDVYIRKFEHFISEICRFVPKLTGFITVMLR